MSEGDWEGIDGASLDQFAQCSLEDDDICFAAEGEDNQGDVVQIGKPGRGFEDTFQVLEELGSGSYGKVFKVKHKVDEHFYAVKIVQLEKDQANAKRALRECQKLARVEHPGVVRYINSWIDTQCPDVMLTANRGESLASQASDDSKHFGSEYLFIQMELCGQTLQEYFHTVSDETDPIMRLQKHLGMFLGLIDALAFMHDQGLIHRDLKPDNIFQSSKDPTKFKIGDWGSVKGEEPIKGGEPSRKNSVKTEELYEADDYHEVFTSYSDSFGTLGYVAPEVTKKMKYTSKVDVYSLGNVLLHFVLPKATAQEFIAMRKAIVEGRDKTIWPIPLRVALNGCLRNEADERNSLQLLRLQIDEASSAVASILKVDHRIGLPFLRVKPNGTNALRVLEGEKILVNEQKLCLQGVHGTQKTRVALEIGSNLRRSGYMTILVDMTHVQNGNDAASEILKSLGHPPPGRFEDSLKSLKSSFRELAQLKDLKLFWILRNCNGFKLDLFTALCTLEGWFEKCLVALTSATKLPIPTLPFPDESSITESLLSMQSSVTSKDSAANLLKRLPADTQKLLLYLSLLPHYDRADKFFPAIVGVLKLNEAPKDLLMKFRLAGVLKQKESGQEYLHWHLKELIGTHITFCKEEVITVIVTVILKSLLRQTRKYWSENGSQEMIKSRWDEFYFDLLCTWVREEQFDSAFTCWIGMNSLSLYHAICYLGVHSIQAYDKVLEGFLRITERFSPSDTMSIKAIIILMLADDQRRNGNYDVAMEKVRRLSIEHNGGEYGSFVDAFRFYLMGRILSEQMEDTKRKFEDILNNFRQALLSIEQFGLNIRSRIQSRESHAKGMAQLVLYKSFKIFLARAYHMQKAKHDQDLLSATEEISAFLDLASSSSFLGRHVFVGRCWREFGDLFLTRGHTVFASQMYGKSASFYGGTANSDQPLKVRERDETEYMKLLVNWGKSKCLLGEVGEGYAHFEKAQEILDRRYSSFSKYGYQFHIKQSEAFYSLYMKNGLEGLTIAQQVGIISQERFQRQLKNILGPSIFKVAADQKYDHHGLVNPSFRRAVCRNKSCKVELCLFAHTPEEKRN